MVIAIIIFLIVFVILITGAIYFYNSSVPADVSFATKPRTSSSIPRTCNVGYYLSGSVCLECPDFSTSKPGSVSESDCKCDYNSTMLKNRCVCNRGFIRSNDTCVPCDSYTTDPIEVLNCIMESTSEFNAAST